MEQMVNLINNNCKGVTCYEIGVDYGIETGDYSAKISCKVDGLGNITVVGVDDSQDKALDDSYDKLYKAVEERKLKL